MKPRKPHKPRPPKPRHKATATTKASPTQWLYGFHSVKQGIANPKRKCLRLLTTHNPQQLAQRLDTQRLDKEQASKPLKLPPIQQVQPAKIARLLPKGAVHQGLALEVLPLKPPSIDQIARQKGIVVVLDEIQDPRNVGAIMRTAAFFGVVAVIAPSRRNATPLDASALNPSTIDTPTIDTPTMAKAASGALEVTPLITVTNINQTLSEVLTPAGWQIIGLAGEAELELNQINPLEEKIALVVGKEQTGLRKLVRTHCHQLARLGTNALDAKTLEGGKTLNPITSLNVSAATAIAVYNLQTRM